jgi:ketosteroid isomerase-like protein
MRFLYAGVFAVLVVSPHLSGLCFAQADQSKREDLAVRNVIELWVQAVNSADVTMLLAQFSEDARIESKVARGTVNKQQYGDAMAKAFRAHALVGMSADIMNVTLVDQAHATVLATIYPMSNARRYVYVVEWKLEKRGGRWVVVEATYKSTAPPVVFFDVAWSSTASAFSF